MKIHKRLKRNVGRTDLHSCISRRVKHPCRHDNCSTVSFDDDNVTPGALLAIIAPHRTSVERMPAVVESLLLARYGQNNPAIAVGRRNWTFAGSDEGGRRAAALYTLIATAKLNDVDPQAWLADVLARMLDYPAKRIADLLPWNWHAEHRAAA